MKIRLLSIALLLLLEVTPLSANADLQDGLAAYASQNWTVAFEEFKPMADDGNPAAQFYLASMYFNGWGVKQNDTQAVDLFRASAEAGFPAAQFLYGAIHLIGGRGVSKNDEIAENYIRAAAEQGVLEAMYHVGGFYKDGVVYEISYIKACAWYEAAAQLGYINASGKCPNLVEEKQLSESQVSEIVELAHQIVVSVAETKY